MWFHSYIVNNFLKQLLIKKVTLCKIYASNRTKETFRLSHVNYLNLFRDECLITLSPTSIHTQ